jgi:hypothetical protein
MSKLKKKKCPSSIISASKVLDKVFFANRHWIPHIFNVVIKIFIDKLKKSMWYYFRSLMTEIYRYLIKSISKVTSN